jgi:DNA replication protein DnaC
MTKSQARQAPESLVRPLNEGVYSPVQRMTFGAFCDEMYASLADRASRKLIRRWARLDVLLIDEVGYLNLRPEQTNIFFKLMEERYRRKATLITTNLEYDQWARLLGNKDLTEALLSRLRHQCQTIHINGPSLREPQG